MSIDREKEEAQKLTLELAPLTSESIAPAATKDVRGRRKNVRGLQASHNYERLLAVGKNCAAHLT